MKFKFAIEENVSIVIEAKTYLDALLKIKELMETEEPDEHLIDEG